MRWLQDGVNKKGGSDSRTELKYAVPFSRTELKYGVPFRKYVVKMHWSVCSPYGLCWHIHYIGLLILILLYMYRPLHKLLVVRHVWMPGYWFGSI